MMLLISYMRLHGAGKPGLLPKVLGCPLLLHGILARPLRPVGLVLLLLLHRRCRDHLRQHKGLAVDAQPPPARAGPEREVLVALQPVALPRIRKDLLLLLPPQLERLLRGDHLLVGELLRARRPRRHFLPHHVLAALVVLAAHVHVLREQLAVEVPPVAQLRRHDLPGERVVLSLEGVRKLNVLLLPPLDLRAPLAPRHRHAVVPEPPDVVPLEGRLPGVRLLHAVLCHRVARRHHDLLHSVPPLLRFALLPVHHLCAIPLDLFSKLPRLLPHFPWVRGVGVEVAPCVGAPGVEAAARARFLYLRPAPLSHLLLVPLELSLDLLALL
mmetsp:Transcript_50459/g.161474  ORF Transcript_50459/g.161474 Transcript_50459/m.161474 type:complete len:327 (-) Transcript_50459:1316-2296(-)